MSQLHVETNRATRLAFAIALLFVLVGSMAAGCSNESSTSSTSRESQQSSDTVTSDAGEHSNDAPSDAEVDPDSATGSIDEVEPEGQEAPTAEPINLDEIGDFGNGVTARVTDIRSIEAEAALPGEVSGPAVQLTIEMTNSTESTVNLDNVAVVVTSPSGVPAPPMSSQQVERFQGELAAGGSASGTYVFSIEPADRADARLTVKYAADAPTIVFTGTLPNA